MLTWIVKPIKLSRTKITYVLGASITTRLSEYKDGSTHGGIPSTLEEIPEPNVRVGNDQDGDYSEIIVPDSFEPGSILVYATDMHVSSSYERYGETS